MSKISFRVIKKLVGTPSPTIVEVGAHYGEDSMKFIKAFPLADLHCFEPDPRNIMVLKKRMGDIHYHLNECAVSDKDSLNEPFHQGYDPDVPDRVFDKYSWIPKKDYIEKELNASGSSSLKRGHPLLKNGKTIGVPTMRLDRYLASNNRSRVDFLWIDVQGAEREVIYGLGAFIPAVRYIWTEYGETEYEGAMGRLETIHTIVFEGFNLMEKYSSSGKSGNLLFRNNNEK